MKTGQNSPIMRTRSVPVRGFSLLEVMVASAIFFMVAFAILEMVTRALVGVRALQQREPDPGIILAMYSTNKAWQEMTISGNYDEIAPGMYPGYTYDLDVRPYLGTNQFLYEAIVVSHSGGKSGKGPATASTLYFSPNSKPLSGLNSP